MASKQNQSHIGLGVLIGTAIGVAAASYLSSKDGKKMMKDVNQKSDVMQKKLMKKLGTLSEMSKEKYNDVVDMVSEYYLTAKDIQKSELPEMKKMMKQKWTDIQKELKDAGKAAPVTKKRSAKKKTS